MFHSFFEQFFSFNSKSRTSHLISTVSRKLFITSHPKVWMFFTGLMLVVALFFCFRPELFRNVHESFPIREAHATSHVATSETASLIGAEIPEKQKNIPNWMNSNRNSAWHPGYPSVTVSPAKHPTCSSRQLTKPLSNWVSIPI